MIPICIQTKLEGPHGLSPVLYAAHVLSVRELVVGELARRRPLMSDEPREILVQRVSPGLLGEAELRLALGEIVGGVRSQLGEQHRYTIGQRRGPWAVEVLIRDSAEMLLREDTEARLLDRIAQLEKEVALLRGEAAMVDAFGLGEGEG